MSVYMTLAVCAVLLFLIVVGVMGALATVAAVHLSKAYTSRQRYSLMRHAYDKGGHDDLRAMTEAVRSLDGDLQRGTPGDQSVDQRRVPSVTNDNRLLCSEDVPRSLPAMTSPDRQLPKK